jgi:hypothetical protein
MLTIIVGLMKRRRHRRRAVDDPMYASLKALNEARVLIGRLGVFMILFDLCT